METEIMVSQGKASKTQKTPSHEFCHGYVDKNGIWNNGFYCRRWGKPDDKYCCDDLDVRYCCPEPSPSTRSTTPDLLSTTPLPLPEGQGVAEGNSILLPIIIGSGVGVALIVCCLLVVCLACRCSAGRKRSNKPVTGNKRLSFSVEAEATSAVIAAQALQKEEHHHHHHHQQKHPLMGHDSKPHSCNGDDGQLHCGCRWSPSTSQSTVVDLDSLIATMQQNISNSWQQQEMETTLVHPANCPCDQHGRSFNPLLNTQGKRIFNTGDRPINGNVSPSITMDPFRPPSLNTRQQQQQQQLQQQQLQQQQQQQQQHYFQMDENGAKSLQFNPEQNSLLNDRSIRGYTYSPHNQMNEIRQMKFLAHECSDRQRRDSGVLVEEPDVVQDTNSFGANKFPSPPILSHR